MRRKVPKLSAWTRKVGDTITATATDENGATIATGVTYQWFMGDSAASITTQISGAASNTLEITSDMVGKYIQVVAEGDGNSSASATTTVAVREADSTKIEIVKAEQTGAKTIKATFSNPVTSSDTLSVKKGSNSVAIYGKRVHGNAYTCGYKGSCKLSFLHR